MPRVLTGNSSALTVGCCQLGVEVDVEVLFDGDLVVSLLDGGTDPFSEGLAEYGKGDVDDPLLWQLGDLLPDGEVLMAGWFP